MSATRRGHAPSSRQPSSEVILVFHYSSVYLILSISLALVVSYVRVMYRWGEMRERLEGERKERKERETVCKSYAEAFHLRRSSETCSPERAAAACPGHNTHKVE